MTSTPTAGSIPTFESTQRDQEDLEFLTRDRPMLANSRFGPNSYYGIDRILLRAASLPATYPLNAVVPHGVVFDRRAVWTAEARARVPAVLCYPEFRVESYARATDKQVLPAASPATYVIEELARADQPDRTGTIFFVDHSTHHVVSPFSSVLLPNSLRQAPEWARPITVCMYWRDIQLGRHIPFRELGFTVVSAGHLYDPHFLYRLYWLCAKHRYASANAFGTHTFFSVLAGCVHTHLKSVPHSSGVTVRDIPSGEVVIKRVDVRPASIDALDLSEVFHDPEPNVRAQRETAGYFLGRGHLLGSSELVELFRDLRRLDRRPLRISQETPQRRRFALPGWLTRGVALLPMRYQVRRLLRWLYDRHSPRYSG